MRAEVGFCTGPTVKTFTPFLKIDLPSHFKVFICIFEDYFTHKNLRAPLEILFYQNPAALGRNPQRGSTRYEIRGLRFYDLEPMLEPDCKTQRKQMSTGNFP